MGLLQRLLRTEGADGAVRSRADRARDAGCEPQAARRVRARRSKRCEVRSRCDRAAGLLPAPACVVGRPLQSLPDPAPAALPVKKPTAEPPLTPAFAAQD